MTDVVVDWVVCGEETDELGDDDVYLMLFRGELPAAGGIQGNTEFTVTGPGTFWDDMSTYDVRKRDCKVSRYDRRSVYVVQLIERDNGRDVKGSVESAYRSALDIAWTGALARTVGRSDDDRRAPLIQTIKEAMRGLNTLYMEFPKGNDDWIGSPKELAVRADSLITIDFKGDGGRYRVGVKVVA
jgi:hypothetical protein